MVCISLIIISLNLKQFFLIGNDALYSILTVSIILEVKIGTAHFRQKNSSFEFETTHSNSKIRVF